MDLESNETKIFTEINIFTVRSILKSVWETAKNTDEGYDDIAYALEQMNPAYSNRPWVLDPLPKIADHVWLRLGIDFAIFEGLEPSNIFATKMKRLKNFLSRSISGESIIFDKRLSLIQERNIDKAYIVQEACPATPTKKYNPNYFGQSLYIWVLIPSDQAMLLKLESEDPSSINIS